jgi:hypothetical protein
MCNCKSEILERAKEQLESKLVNKSEAETVRARWSNEGFGVDPKGEMVTVLYSPIERKYQSFKKDGTPYKNLTKSNINVHFTFCPFCGVEIK